jgi:hypothetical protein
MGITIHQSPTGYTSAHEEVWHVVESTDKDLAGFQYVFDIYKDTTLLTRIKNSPLGASKLGVIDVGNIVRSSLDSYNFPAFNLSSFTNEVTLGADIFFTDYRIEYGQFSGMVDFTGNIASGNYRVYNNYKRSKWDKYTSEIVSGMFLTNRPATSNYYTGEPIVASVFVGNEEMRRYYILDGSDEDSKIYSTSGQFNTAYSFGIIPVSGNVIFNYTDGSDNILDTLTFNQKCSKYETHTLIFLNAFGAYDSFTFVHGKLMMSNEKKKFEQMRWQLSGNSMVEKSGAVYNESMKTYAVKYKEKMMLTSDILSTGEYNWLSELINSPQVYYYSTENAEYYPVQITDTDYEFKDDRINKADTLSVTIEFSTPQNTQYR